MSTQGNNLTYRWLAGILISVLVSVFGFISLKALSIVERIDNEHRDGVVKFGVYDDRFKIIDKRLERIEDKLDKVLSN